MIPKSGYRFSEQVMLRQEHDPEKWIPVFGTGHAPSKVSAMALEGVTHGQVHHAPDLLGRATRLGRTERRSHRGNSRVRTAGDRARCGGSAGRRANGGLPVAVVPL